MDLIINIRLERVDMYSMNVRKVPAVYWSKILNRNDVISL